MAIEALQKEYQTVILAAFLHDIGKILMRGDFGAGLNIEGKHPQVSANFVGAFKDVFSDVADESLLELLVQRHHEDTRLPKELLVQGIQDGHQRTLAALVSKADNLSSSERGERSQEWQDYKTTPLMCVLERVNHESDALLKLRFHARALPPAGSLDVIFPEQFAEYPPNELNQHIRSFGKEFKRLFRPDSQRENAVDKTDFDTLLTHLTSLIYRYTWCIASDTQQRVPDVSLFDHLKTTAAIATCLYRYHAATDSLTERSLAKPGKDRFCLAVGDMSGIQSYIFDIAGIGVGGVAKRLRARSLYVQLCSEVAAHALLHRLKLPLLNMIMNSGGKFYLLLPNLPETISAVHEVQKQTDEWFLKELNGELALNLAYVAFDEEGFETERGEQSGFGTILGKATEELDQRKRRRFAESLTQSEVWSEDFFVGRPFEGKGACGSCGKFPAEKDDLCIHCSRDAETGSRLTRSGYIAFYAAPYSGNLPLLGYSAGLVRSPDDLKGDPYLVMKLNDTDVSDMGAHPAMTKYVANHVARFTDCSRFDRENKRHGSESNIEGDDPATFECIAHRAEGAGLLGFLKADVDDLGKTFVFGLKRKDDPVDTISRVTTMSRMLDLFFSGWVQCLTSTKFRNSYIVFSGGDDLLIVGPWDEIPRLAERMRTDLDRFTGNPTISMSAGILMAKPGLPVARAAEGAEEALKLSKSPEDKNRLTILRHTLCWGDWGVVHNEWEQLGREVSGDGAISSAFLYRLLRYAEMWRRYKDGDILGLRYQPLLAYDIARNLNARKSPEVLRWAQGLLQMPAANTRQQVILDNLGLVASLLIYSKRGGRE